MKYSFHPVNHVAKPELRLEFMQLPGLRLSPNLYITAIH